MKMNDTVARIVEIMFQDVEQNEETAAIRDEVMNNCQERYIDLVNSGVSEDDAIAAVIESLKGMDEILAPYKQSEELEDMDDDELNSKQHVIFAADMVHTIDLHLINEDVNIEASDDENYHVIWDTNENSLVKVELRNGVMAVERMPGDAFKKKNDGQLEYHHKDGASDFVCTENGSITINMNSIDGMLKSIGDSLKNAFSKSNLHINVGFGDSPVTIQVPENAIPHVKLMTTSGDIDVQEAALADLNVISTSGDINIDLNENQCLKLVEVRTTSGDIEATAFTHEMTIASTSGDVEVEGCYHNLTVNTISGDIDVRADVMNLTFKAVSGDVDLAFNSNMIRDVRGNTISGDIDIDLPDGLGFMDIHTQTRSGDVTTRCHTTGDGPTVTGSVTSMSGDITIH